MMGDSDVDWWLSGSSFWFMVTLPSVILRDYSSSSYQIRMRMRNGERTGSFSWLLTMLTMVSGDMRCHVKKCQSTQVRMSETSWLMSQGIDALSSSSASSILTLSLTLPSNFSYYVSLQNGPPNPKFYGFFFANVVSSKAQRHFSVLINSTFINKK